MTALAIVGTGHNESRFAIDVAREGVELVAVRGASALRTCTTLLERNGRATELVENAGPEPAATLAALRARHEMRALTEGGARWALVSDGAWPARLLERGGVIVKLEVPSVRCVVNPIGSGDTLLAGIAVALLGGASMRDAVARGLEAAAANVGTELPGRI